MVALALPSEAKIVYKPAHVSLGDKTVTHYHLDLNHDGVGDFSLSYPGKSGGPHSAELIVQPMVKGNEVVERLGGTFHQAHYPAALSAGTVIGPKQHFRSAQQQVMAEWNTASGPTATYRGNWINVRNRYLGLKFLIGGKAHYGWARLNVSVSSGLITGTLTGYAYETISNKPIIAGKTKGPDAATVSPASLGHLAAGASAIPAWRTTGGSK